MTLQPWHVTTAAALVVVPVLALAFGPVALGPFAAVSTLLFGQRWAHRLRPKPYPWPAWVGRIASHLRPPRETV